MFKSKIFQYCAIAATVVITSGAIVASNATLQSQQSKIAQSQSQPEPEKPSLNKLTESPDQDRFTDKLSERTNSPDIPSGRVLKQLNLSTEQLQKLKAVRDRDRDRIQDLVQQSRQANKELRDLLVSNESSDVIRAKHTQVLNLQQELQKQNFERMLAMREILTPQQRSQLNEIRQKNQNRPSGMRERIQNRMEKRENLRDRA